MAIKRVGFLVRVIVGAAFVFAGLPTQTAGAAAIRYAKPTGLTTGTCTSWSTACQLRYALATVAVYGDQIWVAKGTYKPTAGTDRAISFVLKSGVAVYGGFLGSETALSQRNPVANVTILSGDIGIAGETSDNSYHVVDGSYSDGTGILEGFTITKGRADGASHPTDFGAGMLNVGGKPSLSKLIFTDNTAAWGAGMHNVNSNVSLTNVTFVENHATSGAGMYNYTSSPTLTNVTFSKNGAANDGGGMANDTTSNPELKNVTFSNNTAGGYGGAIWNSHSSPTLKQVTVGGNSASTWGHGMYNDNESYPISTNSIFWGPSPQIINTISASTFIDSIVVGGCPYKSTCTHVINKNPQLGSLQNNGGWTPTRALGAGSAGIDAGGTVAACEATDQRGVARPQGSACDMGAYEVKALSLVSGAAYDGWVLESSETSSVGGSMDSTSSTVRVGDDASDRQYVGLLSFNTSSVPDAATVVLGKLRVMRQSQAGTNPFITHGALTLDLKAPFFGAGLVLETIDFQAAAGVTPAGTIGSTLSGGWYTGLLNSGGRGAVNKTGVTQLRLRFNVDDNNDNGADYLSLYSANVVTATYRPKLIVYYNP